MSSTEQPTPRLELPERYYYPDAEEAAHIYKELRRELPEGHPLFGVPVELFASSTDNQDAVPRYPHDPERFTIVHLTWIGRTEINPGFPSVNFDGTFAEFVAQEEEICDLINRKSLDG